MYFIINITVFLSHLVLFILCINTKKKKKKILNIELLVWTRMFNFFINEKKYQN